MIKRAIALLVALCVAAISVADPRPVYVSWIPGTPSLEAGSKPTIRITLDVAPEVDTPIAISTSDPAKVALPGSTVVAMAGSRYVTFPVTLNGVDADSPVTISANSGGVILQSPRMTILASRLIRVTFNTSPVNELHSNTLTEIKFTLSGPAGPGGYTISLGLVSINPGSGTNSLSFSAALFDANAFDLTVPYGQSIARRTFTVPTATGGGGSVTYTGPGTSVVVTTPFTLLP